MKNSLNKKQGFTLAEILITLTVIGVVAALTIPTLLQNTNQAELKAALKRDFADLSQATLSIKNDLGGSLVNAFPGANSMGSEALKNAFKAKLSYIKECSGTPEFGGSGTGLSAEGCWHVTNAWQNLNGIKRIGEDHPGLILNNGTLVNFGIYESNCSLSNGDFKACGDITFDVNGFKPPNTIGKDIFAVSLTGDGIIPFGARGYFDVNDTTNGCLSTARGWGCAAKFLYTD